MAPAAAQHNYLRCAVLSFIAAGWNVHCQGSLALRTKHCLITTEMKDGDGIMALASYIDAHILGALSLT